MVSFICLTINLALLTGFSESRPASINTRGSVTTTQLQNFPFIDRIANPCEIGTATASAQFNDSIDIIMVSINSTQSEEQMSFYQSLATSVEIAQRKLRLLSESDSECNVLSLKSLPTTRSLTHLNPDEFLKQAYKSAIFLATHFHLVAFDRQLDSNGQNNQSKRFQRCGSETEEYLSNIQEIASQMEGVVCTILAGATEVQEALFRRPFDELQKQILYRYHNSCSMLQTRDCLVIREGKQATELILRKLESLMEEEGNGNSSSTNTTEDEDLMDNTV